MPAIPHALLLKFPGTNCDAETARALEAAGFTAEVLPVALLEPAALDRAKMIVFSGGFSYGGYVLGICNGFQILTQLDLLPRGSLIHNTSGRFICRWAPLKKNGKTSPYLRALPDDFELPVAHAEGRFVGEPGDAEKYVKDGHAALLYGRDVNGSTANIAGMQDDTGRVFGLMPHPERFLFKSHHYDPDWSAAERGWGYYFFKGVAEAIAA